MTSFLLIISFLLHIIAFIAIYQLYKQAQLPKQDSSSREMMELFEVYLAEIKEENKRLEETLVDKKEYTPANDTLATTPLVNEEPRKKEPANSYKAPEVDNSVQFETSLQARILQLYNQGMSNEEIARKLSCGKTEVDLIVKLHAEKED